MATLLGVPPAAELEQARRSELLLSRGNLIRLSLLAFTIFYFADVYLRASAKYFWYDELLTLYFARLPDLHSLWGALHSGLESNPPTFHLLTRWTEALFGEGLFATRLPEILSFWIMCLCLFKFVERRAGLWAGYIALMLPMLTGAYFYAYEARPLIIVAAWAAIALLCWDNAKGLFSDGRWLFGFSVALIAAFLMHCYALLLIIPFGLVELIRDIRQRRISLSFWVALLLPLIPAALLYMPLLSAFRRESRGTDFAISFPALWPEVLKFYSYLLLPCTAILLLALSLFALDRVRAPHLEPTFRHPSTFSWDDAILCLGFASLPAFGVLLGQFLHTPYFGRYFLAALLGFCIPFAINAGAANARTWIAPILTIVMVFSLGLNFVRIARHRLHGEGETMVEPSTLSALSTTPGHPLQLFPLIKQIRNNSEAIGVLEPLDFLYLLNYAPDLRSRLYYIHSSEADASWRGLRAFLKWSPVKYNPILRGDEFIDSHRDFYIYSDLYHTEEFYRLARMASIRSFKAVEDHFLADMQSNLASAAHANPSN